MFPSSIVKAVFMSIGLAIALGPSITSAQSGTASTGSNIMGAIGQVPSPATSAIVAYSGSLKAADFEGARVFGRMACTQGWAAACTRVARIMSEPGLGTPRPIMARQSAQRACELGNAEGCYVHAALLALNPSTSPLDRNLVPDAYKKGCDLNHGESCAILGRRHQAGEGGPVNLAEARAYTNKALTIDTNNAVARQTLALLNPSAAPKTLPRTSTRAQPATWQPNAADCKGVGTIYANRGDISRAEAVRVGQMNLIAALGRQIKRGRNLQMGLISSTTTTIWPQFDSPSITELEGRVVLCERAHADQIPPVPAPPPRT